MAGRNIVEIYCRRVVVLYITERVCYYSCEVLGGGSGVSVIVDSVSGGNTPR